MRKIRLESLCHKAYAADSAELAFVHAPIACTNIHLRTILVQIVPGSEFHIMR